MSLILKTNWQHKLMIASGVFALATSAIAATTTATSTVPMADTKPSITEQIEFTIEPSFPKPESDVKVTLEAYGMDLNTANIAWIVNGKTAKEGVGEKTFSLKAGKEGSVTKVEASIETQDGQTVKKQFYINPQTVDIIWEARTYTPPFYKGRSAYTPQEKIVFAAMPNLTTVNGSPISPRQTIYKWIKDDTVLGSLSGYGRSSYLYGGSVLGIPVNVTVEASAETGQAARAHVTISPTAAEVGFYEDSPSLGILFNREISSGLNLTGAKEKSIAVYPYYFGVSGVSDSRLSYTWTMNGARLEATKDQSRMTFRNEGNENGVATIGMIINNDTNFLQGAIGGTVINFFSEGKATQL